MIVALAQKFKDKTREIRHPSVRQHLPNKNHPKGYKARFNILAGAMGLPQENFKTKQWHLAQAIRSESESSPDLSHRRLLENIIHNNQYIFDEQCRILGIATEQEIQKVSTQGVVSISGYSLSPVQAYFKQPQMDRASSPLASKKPPVLKIVR